MGRRNAPGRSRCRNSRSGVPEMKSRRVEAGAEHTGQGAGRNVPAAGPGDALMRGAVSTVNRTGRTGGRWGSRGSAEGSLWPGSTGGTPWAGGCNGGGQTPLPRCAEGGMRGITKAPCAVIPRTSCEPQQAAMRRAFSGRTGGRWTCSRIEQGAAPRALFFAAPCTGRSLLRRKRLARQ